MNEKEIINSDVKYEAEDVSGKWIGAIGAVIVVTAIILIFLMWGFYGYFEMRDGHGAPLPEAKNLERFNAPPAPDLEPDPVGNYREFRRAENEKLNDYGWIDREKGTVHIPIEQAMKQLTQKGLPAIQPMNQTPVADDNTNAMPPNPAAGAANQNGGVRR